MDFRKHRAAIVFELVVARLLVVSRLLFLVSRSIIAVRRSFPPKNETTNPDLEYQLLQLNTTPISISIKSPTRNPHSCTHRAIMAGRFVRASKYRQHYPSPNARHEIRLTAGQDMFLGSRRGRNLAMTTCTLVATRGIPIW